MPTSPWVRIDRATVFSKDPFTGGAQLSTNPGRTVGPCRGLKHDPYPHIQLRPTLFGSGRAAGCATCRTRTRSPPEADRKPRGEHRGWSSGRRYGIPRSSCRLLDPQDHRSFEHITPPSATPPPLFRSRTSSARAVLSQRPVALLGNTLLFHPVPQRTRIEDPNPGPPGQSVSQSPEQSVPPPDLNSGSYLLRISDISSSSKSKPPRYGGKPTTPNGTHLRTLRQKTRITLTHAAQALQTHPTLLSRLERNQYHHHQLATRYQNWLTHPPQASICKNRSIDTSLDSSTGSSKTHHPPKHPTPSKPDLQNIGAHLVTGVHRGPSQYDASMVWLSFWWSDEHHVGGIGQVGAGGEFPNQFPIDAGVCRENAVFLNVMTPPRDRAIPRVETSCGTELPTCIF